MRWFLTIPILACSAGGLAASPTFAEPIVVDHNHTDLSRIPDAWIARVKQNVKVYYGHTSHGQQLVTGLKLIEEQLGKKYDVSVNWPLPSFLQSGLPIRDRSDTYNPSDFFATVDSALARNPKVNVVIYGWCSQPNKDNWQQLLNEYIGTMNDFEKRHPKTTFVYMTAHAQRRGLEGCNRNAFNESLRAYCRKNNKVLFDFGDLDVWWSGNRNSYVGPDGSSCAAQDIPLEHSRFGGGRGDGPFGHTTRESCVIKGKATWWLLARIAGWNPEK